MKRIIERSSAFLLVLAFVTTPVWATCGGGGGGGGGGMTSNNSNNAKNNDPVVYHVPWKMPPKTNDKPVTEGLVLYWFPANAKEISISPLKESRNLSLYASQCVTMQLADVSTANADKLIGGSTLPVAVLANPDGTAINKIENVGGKLKVADVEKLVGGEIKTRSDSLDKELADAKEKAAAGDKAAAIELYKSVAAAKCMFPKKAKAATAELKKLGEANVGMISEGPNFDPAVTASIVRVMKQGLVAENNGRYVLADQLYRKANAIDPADPTPLRYMGELYRHHIGNWIKARAAFNKILRMPSDPLSRAVALHGLGKMTIHDGEFKRGLALMEQSADVYPIALTYRNLAVYWNSEGEMAKANEYTGKALALDPDDAYNRIFAAVYLAQTGKKDEAMKIATENIDLLPASYNLAAIFALNGQKEKALELLKRHFYEFERYRQVREKEMMEARVDAVFDSIRFDKDFLALTAGADGKLPVPMAKTGGGTLN
jgi:tetratricopeptide (TPR) repeat protein